MLEISEIWRFPVKSMGGERMEEAEVNQLGIIGDRGWGIFEPSTETVLTARRAPELLFASAVVAGTGVAIELPDGTRVNSDDDACDEALSDWLARTVELHRAGAEGGTYEVPLDFENDEKWVSWQGPPRAWHDSSQSRVSLVSRETLRDWDPRRFRTNLILDGSGEDELVGVQLEVGNEVRLNVTKAIDRCVIVTRPQPGLDRDLDVLRTINAERNTCLAVGALVASPGTIRQGNRVASTG